MAYVRVSPSCPFQLLTVSDALAGSGKTIISYVSPQQFFSYVYSFRRQLKHH